MHGQAGSILRSPSIFATCCLMTPSIARGRASVAWIQSSVPPVSAVPRVSCGTVS